jgi:rubrerythrin
MSVEQKTGIPDPHYNLVSVLYHALQAAETHDMYIADAEEAGDRDLASFFREVQQKNREVADKAKRLLRERLSA